MLTSFIKRVSRPAVFSRLFATQDDVFSVLENIEVINNKHNLVSAGLVDSVSIDGDRVGLSLSFPTPAFPKKDDLVEAAKSSLINGLADVSNVDVNTSIRTPIKKTKIDTMKNIEHVVLVSSCKGGVGKSTVSVNLARSLANLGARVAIFDADIYGPSLPFMVNVDKKVRYNDEKTRYLPAESDDMKCQSYGFMAADGSAGEGQAAIMRGPMVSNVIDQLLKFTEWGELDYLVIDCPPGTGDIHLTLSQMLEISGGVVVTTPQKLSFVDVVKGIEMFQKLNVPTLGLVENMSYFECEHGTKYRPFGMGHSEEIQERYDVGETFFLPLDGDVSLSSDSGHCVSQVFPDSPAGQEYKRLAETVVEETLLQSFTGSTVPRVSSVVDKGIVLRWITDEGAEEKVLNPAEVRRKCRCALCIDEMTGQRTLKDEDVPDDVEAVLVEPKGNYAVHLQWTDGHTSLMPYRILEEMALTSEN